MIRTKISLTFKKWHAKDVLNVFQFSCYIHEKREINRSSKKKGEGKAWMED